MFSCNPEQSSRSCDWSYKISVSASKGQDISSHASGRITEGGIKSPSYDIGLNLNRVKINVGTSLMVQALHFLKFIHSFLIVVSIF